MHAVIIDAHHHFWRTNAQDQPWRDRSHLALAADFGPADLIPELKAAGVDRTILVQSVDEPAENDRLADYAQDSLVAGVVAWLPLSRPKSALAELERIRMEKICGVRCLVGRDPLEWLHRPGSLSLLRELAQRDLVWDVVPVTDTQTEAILRLARTVPELRIVIDHLARPPLESKVCQPWAHRIEELAECQNVALKVSVGMDALNAWEWRREELIPYVDWAAARFGAARLMAASNWPLVLLRSTYQQAWGDLHTVIEHAFPDIADQRRLLGGTAERWYRLNSQ